MRTFLVATTLLLTCGVSSAQSKSPEKQAYVLAVLVSNGGEVVTRFQDFNSKEACFSAVDAITKITLSLPKRSNGGMVMKCLPK